jgi:2,4-dienoyl-CoA reductase-like NADH-dependent reductase (Old Yellow Enzyme family)/threonine dehydrogenase-like Zn-dependent dehydrogenase
VRRDILDRGAQVLVIRSERTAVTGPSESVLLTPIEVGAVTVKNRIVSTAHGAFTDFNSPTDDGRRYIEYQRRRAAGGCGMIVLQAMHVHRTSAQTYLHPMPDPDDMRAKLTELANVVAPHGTTLVQQIFHFGAMGVSDSSELAEPRWSFSAATTPEGEASHAMTPAEIEEVLDGFVDAAVLAVESGLHGVELHATHGYLLQQSFSPWGNQRDDEWGEPLRFATELIDRVRVAVGPDRIVGLRISADDFRSPDEGGLGADGLAAVAATLVAGGKLDYLNHSEGSKHPHYARAIGSYRHPHGEFLPLTAGLRRAIDAAVPVIGVGRITTPELAEQAIRDEACDLVGMTRAQIADPELVSKIAVGRRPSIRPCVGANVCIDARPAGIRCFHNPDVGLEYRRGAAVAAVEPQRVLVVGGGPAGLKAAEAAARAGHQVTLVEQAATLGGRLQAVRHLGRATELLGAITWLERRLVDLGVEVRTSHPATADFLHGFGADAIVLATGARPRPDALGDDDGSIPVLSLDDAAWGMGRPGGPELADRRVLVVDRIGNIDVGLVAEALARVARLSIVTPAPTVGGRVGFTHAGELLPHLHRHGVELLTSREYLGVRDGRAHTRQVFTGQPQEHEVDVVVAGVHPVPDLALSEAAAAAAPVVHLVGDVVAPRGVAQAMIMAEQVGIRLGHESSRE